MKSIYSILGIVIFIFLSIFFFVYQNEQVNPIPHSFSGNEMTIDYRILIGDPLTFETKETVKNIIRSTFNEIDRIYNKWNPNSEISQLNQLKAHILLTLSPELYEFLNRLNQFVHISGGLFDPSIEPLQKLWKDKLRKNERPTIEEIDHLKPCLGWHTLHFEDGKVYKDDDRTQLDLGGTAKGLCVDLLVERLNKAGLNHLYVEWGGEIRTAGYHPSGRAWHIYISRLDNSDPSQAIAHIDLENQALATSGDYFQFWTITENGRSTTYSHIFNPLTLKPMEVKSGSIASASLLALDCVTADSLAKVLMLHENTEEAQKWIEKLQEQFPSLSCWIVTRP